MKLTNLTEKELRLSQVHKTFKETRLLKFKESKEALKNLYALKNVWKNKDIPILQRKIVDQQLMNLREGIIDPVFISLIEALNCLPLEDFSLLDAACASGYYSEVIQSQVLKSIRYFGSDYSEAMILDARYRYPGLKFDVEDLTALTYSDGEFDVVLLAGVLEHIPTFENAISEACRTATSYVILHRCALSKSSENKYTVGALYNIKTPHIYFSKDILIKEFQKHDFSLYLEFDAYTNKKQRGVIFYFKEIVRRTILKRDMARTEATLIFKRK